MGLSARRYGRLRFLSSLGLLTLFSQLTCGGEPSTSPADFAGTDATASTGPFEVLVGAGNVARCDKTNDEATAALLDNIQGTVFMAGDGAYATTGVLPDYVNCYGPSWGRHKSRTRPVIGSLDPWSTGSAAYWDYWGAQAGERNKGYYSIDLGFWHVVFLNSNLTMAVGSAQEQWLRNDLSTTSKRCTVAIFHHPRFSSANGVYDAVKPAWDALYDFQAEVIINAHYGTYERFAPQRPDQIPDPQGPRQFIVGTGGRKLAGRTKDTPNSEYARFDHYGLLKLTLRPDAYRWEFITVDDRVLDTGDQSINHRSIR